MDWTALAAVAELAAAIAVVVSIVYLAAQVRQNTVQVREQVRSHHLASLSAVAGKFAAWRLAIADNGELASLWARGSANIESVTGVERLRFDFLAVEFHRCLSMMWMFADQGVFQASLVEDSTQNASLYAGPGLRAWWRTSHHRSEFPRAFVNRMDGVYAQPRGAPDDREEL